MGQVGQVAGSPMMDPSKNPEGTAAMGEMVAEQAAMMQEEQQLPPE